MTARAAQAGRIVILDDSPLLARQLQQELARFGQAAVILPDEAALLAAAPDAGMAFIELHPCVGNNGFQLAREIKRSCGCAVVLLSGSGRSTDLAWGLRAGAVAVLQRPLQQAPLRMLLAAQQLLPDGRAA